MLRNLISWTTLIFLFASVMLVRISIDIMNGEKSRQWDVTICVTLATLGAAMFFLTWAEYMARKERRRTHAKQRRVDSNHRRRTENPSVRFRRIPR